MFYKRDFSSGQFSKLKELFQEASTCLMKLKSEYPVEAKTWKIIEEKMKIIKHTIDADELPTDEQKRSADLSTMLTHELPDFPDAVINPLYKLDHAYTLLGKKDFKFTSFEKG